jgi:hypothetical protein
VPGMVELDPAIGHVGMASAVQHDAALANAVGRPDPPA